MKKTNLPVNTAMPAAIMAVAYFTLGPKSLLPCLILGCGWAAWMKMKHRRSVVKAGS